jgi:hypothetical protein
MGNYVSIKLCPICGEVPEKTTYSLERPGGHGYAGCHSYQYKCECCKLVNGGDIDDIYLSNADAQNRAKETWNAEVERIQLLLDRQYVFKALVENNVI